jgi:hypothetical protein
MKAQNRRAPDACRRPGAQGCVFRAVDTEDNTGALTAVQAARLLRQFKVSEAVALTIAELAFSTGRTSR